jgi:hypothetical protein
MYVVVRTFSNMQAIGDIARRAESGVGSILKQTPGFKGYYIFDAGDGLGGSVSFFETREAATEANQKAIAWLKESIMDLHEAEAEVMIGEVLATVPE